MTRRRRLRYIYTIICAGVLEVTLPGPAELSCFWPHRARTEPHRARTEPHRARPEPRSARTRAAQGSHRAAQGPHRAAQGSHRAAQGPHSAAQGPHSAAQAYFSLAQSRSLSLSAARRDSSKKLFGKAVSVTQKLCGLCALHSLSLLSFTPCMYMHGFTLVYIYIYIYIYTYIYVYN